MQLVCYGCQTVTKQWSGSLQTADLSDSHQAIIKQSSDSHQRVIRKTSLCTYYSKNTWDTRILNKSLEGTRSFEKKIPLVHKYKPHGFELHGFFLEPKTAYLEALLYSNSRLIMCLILYHPLKMDLINSNTCSYSGLCSILLQNEIQQIMGCIMI